MLATIIGWIALITGFLFMFSVFFMAVTSVKEIKIFLGRKFLTGAVIFSILCSSLAIVCSLLWLGHTLL
jgi:hypothetical protein